jgi:hypothetical protein
MNRTLRGIVLAGILGIFSGPGLIEEARAQAPSAALRDRVNQLVERLASPQAETRQAAEESLIKLGPQILPLLPDPAPPGNADRSQRLDRIRTALRAKAESTPPGASRVTLKGSGIRLSEAIQMLQKQSGNLITDLREQYGGNAANPALNLDIVDQPFLPTLDELARKAEFTPNFFTGDGSVGLMPGAPPKTVVVQYQGPFRLTFQQVTVVRDLQAGTSQASIRGELAWEPRLRPMLLSLKAEKLQIVDDRGQTIAAQVSKESTEIVLRPDNPVAELNINLNAPDRAAKMIAKARIPLEVSVPAQLRTFRFPSLAQKDVTQKEGDLSITLESMEIDEQVWKVYVDLSYPSRGPAFESYRQGLFNNRLWLQKADGSRFEHNGGFSQTDNDQGKLGFEYLFVDVPGKPADYGLVYVTPGKVEPIPAEFEFKDIPLP